jgi:hypothetical protein
VQAQAEVITTRAMPRTMPMGMIEPINMPLIARFGITHVKHREESKVAV